MSQTALISVIYPASLPFLPQLIASVNGQKSAAFTLFLVNDGLAHAGELEALIQVPHQIIPMEGSPLQIRIRILQQLRRMGYEKALFVDADDWLPPNWVAVMERHLQDYPFVCCDLHLTDAAGTLRAPAYWQSRLGMMREFDQAFLLDKNILGFGNCGLQLGEELRFDMPEQPLPAPDWYFFFHNLQRKKALFTAHTHIYYRQHAANQLGISTLSTSRLLQIAQRKLAHYRLLHQQGHLPLSLLSALQTLEEKLKQPDQALEEKIKQLIHQEIHYFWWEETNYLV